jgi:hypothetical protein
VVETATTLSLASLSAFKLGLPVTGVGQGVAEQRSFSGSQFIGNENAALG